MVFDMEGLQCRDGIATCQQIALLGYHPVAQLVAYALSAYLILTARGKLLLHYTLHSALFAVIIVNIATNPKSFFKLESRLLRFLGTTSYAIYMIHEIVVSAVIGIHVRIMGTHTTTRPRTSCCTPRVSW